MVDAPSDPRWPKILSLSVHEFRTPMTVVAGYLRMLLKERAGPVSDSQRRLLEEAEKSCARLSALLAELGDLANLEAGSLPLNRQPIDLRQVLREAAAQLPPLPDREVRVEVQTGDGAAPMHGDAARLQTALSSIIAALRREVVTTDEIMVVERSRPLDGRAGYEILVGDGETLDAIERAGDQPPTVFDEWRGGSGLSLVVARRILNAHGGSVSGGPDGRKTGARILLPSDQASDGQPPPV